MTPRQDIVGAEAFSKCGDERCAERRYVLDFLEKTAFVDNTREIVCEVNLARERMRIVRRIGRRPFRFVDAVIESKNAFALVPSRAPRICPCSKRNQPGNRRVVDDYALQLSSPFEAVDQAKK